MKKFLALTILISFFIMYPAQATLNAKSVTLVRATNQYFDVADNANVSVTGDCSFEAWLKPNTVAGYHIIQAKFNPGANDRSYLFYIDSAEKLGMSWSADGTTANYCTWATTVAISTTTSHWVHLAATVDVSTEIALLYVNGVLTTSTKNSDSGNCTSIEDNTAPYEVGTRTSSGAQFGNVDGLLDEVRLWNDIRTPTEIADNYQTELAGTEAGLVAYYTFDAGDGTDDAGTNDLTENNGAFTYSTVVPFPGSTPPTPVADTRRPQQVQMIIY